MPEFNIPPRKEGIYIQMPKADLEMVLAMLRNPANADKQGRKALFVAGSGYCCLGAMQCAKTGGKVEVNNNYPASNVKFGGYPSHKWLDSVGWRFYDGAGHRSRDPYLPLIFRTASVANDALRTTFSGIADAIEACAEGY